MKIKVKSENGAIFFIYWHGIVEVIESHDSGCDYVTIEGEDDDGNTYYTSGTAQDGDIVDVDMSDVTDENGTSFEFEVL